MLTNQRTSLGDRDGLPMYVIGRGSPVVKKVASALEEHGIALPARTLPARFPGAPVWELGPQPQPWPEPEAEPGGGFILVNALEPDGTTNIAEMTRQVRETRRARPYSAIFVLLDERDPDAVRAARLAGATHYLGTSAANNGEALAWRVSDALGREAGGAAGTRVELTPFAEPSAQEGAAARARVEAGLARVVSPAEMAARASALLSISAEELRDPDSGRIDASLVAERLGVSVSRLAPVTGVSQQALSARPDSLRAQVPLLQIARVLAALDAILPRGQHAMWLRTPRARFGGEAPLAMLLDGRAEALARELEGAVEGLPD